jgi:hypothetical protein
MTDRQPGARASLVAELEKLFAEPQEDVFGERLPAVIERRDELDWEIRRGVIGYSGDPWIRRLRGLDILLRKAIVPRPDDRRYEAEFNLVETANMAPIRRFTYAPEGDRIITDTGDEARPGAAVYNVVTRALGAMIILPELPTADPQSEAA